jgi:V/A-type H+/Na+-transporting ATPase subunit I
MTTETLEKIKIISNQKTRIRVIDFLHKEGFLHLLKDDYSKELNLSRDIHLPIMDTISHDLLENKWILENLKPFYTKKTKPFLFNNNRELNIITKEQKEISDKFYAQISKYVTQINKAHEEKESYLKTYENLKKIPFNFTSDFNHLYDLPTIKKFIFRVKHPELIESIILKLKEENLFEKIYFDLKENTGIILFPAKEKEKIENLLLKFNLKILTSPRIDFSVTKDKNILNKKIKDIDKIITKNHKLLTDIANDIYPKVYDLNKELTIFYERYNATKYFCNTKTTFEINGYISKKDIPRLLKIQHIAKVYINSEVIEQGPTKLRNLPYIKRFEFITKMFGLPKYKETDPTIFISFFLPIFFGFMFSDIGYGVLLLIMSILLGTLPHQYFKIFKDASFVLFISSLTTIFFGFLFGSFFGNLIKITPLLIDPFKEAKTILIISIIFGLIHINLGIFLDIIQKVKVKDYKSIILNNISIICLQAGILATTFQLKQISYIYFAIALFLLLIKTGLMGVMEITSYFGTVFSYARLLALSLATGGIALGINIISTQLYSIALIGPLLFIMVLLIGHTFNFTMNVLGSSIHSVRLHYIEFFSQFYSGEGEEFKNFTTKKYKETL